jgi:hypothetical protein
VVRCAIGCAVRPSPIDHEYVQSEGRTCHKCAVILCDTPGVSFVLRREIYPNLGCSVKISISRSRMSLIIQIIHSRFTEFRVTQSHRRPILDPVKTFILGTDANSKIILEL